MEPEEAPALAAGTEARQEFSVEGQLITDVGGTIGFSVLSTPGMIAMMERNRGDARVSPAT